MRDYNELSLATINDGAAEELFKHELIKVLGNIYDPNTLATKPREITLKIVIVPTPDRANARISLQCTSKIENFAPIEKFATLDLHGNEPRAYQENRKQGDLFEGVETNVKALKGAK